MSNDSLMLYHGTDSKVQNPDLLKCNVHRDFGRAFYLSYNKGLAKDWATKKSPTHAKINDYGIILNNIEDGNLKNSSIHCRREMGQIRLRQSNQCKIRQPIRLLLRKIIKTS